MSDLSKIYNMIWTAGFNSGMKTNQEVIDGKLTSQEEVDKRANELLTQDAESIMMLLKLEQEMNPNSGSSNGRTPGFDPGKP